MESSDAPKWRSFTPTHEQMIGRTKRVGQPDYEGALNPGLAKAKLLGDSANWINVKVDAITKCDHCGCFRGDDVFYLNKRLEDEYDETVRICTSCFVELTVTAVDSSGPVTPTAFANPSGINDPYPWAVMGPVVATRLSPNSDGFFTRHDFGIMKDEDLPETPELTYKMKKGSIVK